MQQIRQNIKYLVNYGEMFICFLFMIKYKHEKVNIPHIYWFREEMKTLPFSALFSFLLHVSFILLEMKIITLST